ncbi:hypothetical protein K435DRAFT_168094 [Dendrothele bispora CBS 962.96]|uniref:DUF6534 domain-containing protein n=1 Tax=Dendrothele bispora (strain CBS 962.96) TaxID=1314807 RepID=A0A4S8LWU5_DENBC|nr:hypothetical protein K435DRAFT_168094 [Dendrothele bispora CBS 962.96]
MMVALLLASILCGIATIQAILYFSANKEDPAGHKIAVGFLWLTDVLHLCFFFHATFTYVLRESNFGPAPYLWSFKVHSFLEVSIMTATKILYLTRIYSLKRLISRWVPPALGVALAIDYVFGMLLAARIAPLKFLHQLVGAPFEWIAFVYMSTTSATDLVIGGVLIYTLARSGSNLSWTNSSWTMLAAYLINTGIIAGIFSLITLISFSAGNVWNPLFIVSEILLPQFYVNCFLSMMNASFYFQTKNPFGERSSSYFPRSSSALDERIEIPILGAQGLRSYTSSSLGSTMYDVTKTNSYTINEVGLPRSKSSETKTIKPEPPAKHVPMQIQVHTTKEEHSVVYPMHRFK